MRLADLQRNLVKNLRDKNNTAVAPLLICDRINIYRNDYVERLIHTLMLIYPVCTKITGTTFFRAMCMEYIKKYTPTSYNLDDYGKELADFIAGYSHAKQLPYLSNVVRLEWFFHRTTIGADITPYNWQLFANIPAVQQGNVIFQLPENSYLMSSKFPLHTIWQINQADYVGDFKINWENTENYFFIWRKEFEVSIENLNLAEWSLLTAIATKKTFTQLSEQNLKIETLLPQLIRKGWVSGFVL